MRIKSYLVVFFALFVLFWWVEIQSWTALRQTGQIYNSLPYFILYYFSTLVRMGWLFFMLPLHPERHLVNTAFFNSNFIFSKIHSSQNKCPPLKTIFKTFLMLLIDWTQKHFALTCNSFGIRKIILWNMSIKNFLDEVVKSCLSLLSSSDELDKNCKYIV